jgi:LysM repeat protein
VRRRQSTPWLQRNALSVAAVAVLVALLSVGFTLAQMLTRSDAAPAMANLPTSSTPIQATTANIVTGAPVDVPPAVVAPKPREIVSSARVLEPSYTVEAGDTLARIADRFGTSVQRIQALNDLADPRALRIGAKLVIPPAF